MTAPDVRCPDCAVTMEEMSLYAGGHGFQVVSDEKRDGLLGSLGANQRFDVAPVVCPECGLTRLYADVEED